MTDDARQIYQAHLERSSRAAYAGDVEASLAHTALPAQIVMADCELVISTEEELGQVIRDYAARLRAEGVVEECEWCTQARFVTQQADMIAGTHVTEWRRDGARAPHRFVNRLVILHFAEGWKSVWLHSGLARSQLEAICPDFIAAQAEKLRALGRLHR